MPMAMRTSSQYTTFVSWAVGDLICQILQGCAVWLKAGIMADGA